jgi:hypothetical protein
MQRRIATRIPHFKNKARREQDKAREAFRRAFTMRKQARKT